MIIASSTRPDQPRWIRAGGPLQTVAVICRNTGWTRRPEPDDLENEGLWCQAVLGTATGCEVLRASKAAVDKWPEPRIPTHGRIRHSRSENAFSGHRRCLAGQQEPCGFAAALGRRWCVAHNSTEPTSE